MKEKIVVTLARDHVIACEQDGLTEMHKTALELVKRANRSGTNIAKNEAESAVEVYMREIIRLSPGDGDVLWPPPNGSMPGKQGWIDEYNNNEPNDT